MASYATKNSAGLDLVAISDTVIAPQQAVMIDTDVDCKKLFLDEMVSLDRWVGFVCPRSGLAIKHKITVLNSPGIIDQDYKGIIKVILMNFGDEPYEIKQGDRVAQVVFISTFARVEGYDVVGGERGANGFGSSGR